MKSFVRYVAAFLGLVMKFILLEGVSHTGATGIQGRPELVAAIREFIAAYRAR